MARTSTGEARRRKRREPARYFSAGAAAIAAGRHPATECLIVKGLNVSWAVANFLLVRTSDCRVLCVDGMWRTGYLGLIEGEQAVIRNTVRAWLGQRKRARETVS